MSFQKFLSDLMREAISNGYGEFSRPRSEYHFFDLGSKRGCGEFRSLWRCCPKAMWQMKMVISRRKTRPVT